MVERENIYSSIAKYEGVFNYKEFYKFCYDWLTENTIFQLFEDEYSEKIKQEGKEIDINWTAVRKMTDYFKYEIKIKFKILHMVEVEVEKNGVKIKLNKGQLKITVKGNLIRDWQGKFERSAYRKFLREIYDKWIIPGRIEQLEDKLVSNSDEFLVQAKAFLALEGKRDYAPGDF